MAGTSPAMTKCLALLDRNGPERERVFIIFVDRIFTTSLQRPFTNVFDVMAQNATIACVYRAGNAD
jgi:hypothetical protein